MTAEVYHVVGSVIAVLTAFGLGLKMNGYVKSKRCDQITGKVFTEINLVKTDISEIKEGVGFIKGKMDKK